jgi:TonB family protein
MRSLRPALLPLALLLLGPALLCAQEPPLAAGSDGVPVPKKKKHVQPAYPKEALAKGLRGIVILDLVIDTEGEVIETHVIRSIPGLDEAAIIAARQWRYEPVTVDGEPVSVRLTVPITFALKLPELTRDRGIPEIRQGVTPAWPEGARGTGRAEADVTLDPDGRIGLARIIEGEEPWSNALLQALRTWRFRPPPEDVSVSFRVAADFEPRGGRQPGQIKLRLSGLRETALLLDAFEEQPPAAVAALEPTGEREGPAERPPSSLPEPPESPPPAPGTAESEPPAPASERTESGPEAADADAESAPPEQAAETRPEPATATPSGAEAPATPASPAVPGAGPEVATAGPAPATGTEPAADPTAPPPVEVLRAMPPPPPPENGISAIRGVLLEPGVPDLTRGRRPVSPPLARMAGVGGVVEVDFSVSAGGTTTVQRTDGPELLQVAATQAVESWIFRRTRADRAYLTAVFTYEDDLASAVVRPQPPP